MVVRPEETKPLTDAEQKEADELEARIDVDLKEGRTVFSMGLFSSLKILDYLMGKYESFGWDIEHTSDQREGGYLTFRPSGH